MEGNAEKPDLMARTEISERRLAFGETTQLARFFFSRVLASIKVSLGSAALVVPPLEGLLAGVIQVRGTPVWHGARPGVPFRFQAARCVNSARRDLCGGRRASASMSANNYGFAAPRARDIEYSRLRRLL
jgi:hypothetical protein